MNDHFVIEIKVKKVTFENKRTSDPRFRSSGDGIAERQVEDVTHVFAKADTLGPAVRKAVAILNLELEDEK